MVKCQNKILNIFIRPTVGYQCRKPRPFQILNDKVVAMSFNIINY